ncbi:hypothetical protein BKN38_08915 [Helicobacter sp. CLO-3]|nr:MULTISPECIES: sel1 repeat family protein [unclassified Helicobacter]OHU81483.1 hypothetical protein BKN38_08915 [Helicobacter sp. CLO-3]
MLGSSVRAEYQENTDDDGNVKASEQVQLYASAQNIGYKILARYKDKKRIYVKIQYDPNKKLINNELPSEFSAISSLEKLCDDKRLEGYYCVELAHKYARGSDGLAVNKSLAQKYYTKGCSMGSPNGCAESAELLIKTNMPEDTHGMTIAQALPRKISSQAKSSFKKACEGGFGYGCLRLASFEEDIKDKRDLYIKGCELNDALSCALVGEIYELGLAHIQQNSAKALRYYARSCDIGERSGSWSISDAASSSAQEMLDGCALFANMQNDRTKLKTLCEDKNNARACVLYADKLSSKDEARAFLVKAASLDSARGHYALSVGTYGDSAYTFGGQAAIFKRACAVGVDVDFTRSCADLGLAAQESSSPIPQEEQVGYLQMACGHVFYDKRACAALPKKLCNNEEVCLEQERQEQEAQALAESAKKANSSKTAKAKASKLGIFADAFYGYGDIELENFREGEYEKQSAWGVKMGVEGYLGGDSFAVFVSPYVGLSMASVYIQMKKTAKTASCGMPAHMLGCGLAARLGFLAFLIMPHRLCLTATHKAGYFTR